ncbi:MAG TPA: oligosaccharide flippase family protein, partial [Candidatus Bathyarchaeia archaeon]|nr:oligosaccharide flippase family protein [Candidatus Bathyarchaeia archaeon]
MSIIRRNIIHNFAGRIISGVLGFVFVPIYIRYLGIEAFGLVGFFVSLQAIVIILDMGLSTTTSREVAKQIGESGDDGDLPSLMYSLELIYVASAVVILGLFISIGGWLAEEWIKAEGIPSATLRWCILVFGFSIAVRWPCGFYSGVLTGAERQVLYNSLYTTFSLLKSAGSVFVVAVISPTIEAFAGWQAFVASAEFVVMKLVYRRLSTQFPGKIPGRFRIDLIRRVWRFSAGVGLNTILAIGIKQLDRILISGMLPIALLGCYTSAHLLYSGLAMISGPFCTATFPRFAKLYAQDNIDDLARLYHTSSQMIAFIVAPAAAVLFFFSFEILSFWTQSEGVAQNASATLSFLSIAG